MIQKPNHRPMRTLVRAPSQIPGMLSKVTPEQFGKWEKRVDRDYHNRLGHQIVDAKAELAMLEAEDADPKECERLRRRIEQMREEAERVRVRLEPPAQPQ